jgi:hypothetical protein
VPGTIPTLPCRLSSPLDRRRPVATPRVPRPYPLVPLPDEGKIFPPPPFPISLCRLPCRSALSATADDLHDSSTGAVALELPSPPRADSLRTSQIAVHREAPTSSAPSVSFAVEGLPVTGCLQLWLGPATTSPSFTSAPRCFPTREPAPSTSGPDHRRRAPPPEHRHHGELHTVSSGHRCPLKSVHRTTDVPYPLSPTGPRRQRAGAAAPPPPSAMAPSLVSAMGCQPMDKLASWLGRARS